MKEAGERGGMSGIFVFVLLGLFALLSSLMVLMSAQAYRSTAARTQQNSQERLITAFVRNALAAADTVQAEQLGGLTVLTLPEGQDADGETYVKRLYCYEGKLMEQLSLSDSFHPENGETICDALALDTRMEGTLLIVTLTDGEGIAREVRFALRTAESREATP